MLAKFKKFMPLFALVLMLVVTSAARAEDIVSLPDVGINVGDYISVLLTALGGIAGAAIAGSLAFFLIRRGISWIKGFIR